MSSPAEGSSTTHSQSRSKSGKTRACDMCRRRKMRCDGSKNPNGICTPCIAQRYKCTYVQTTSKRPTDARYVEALEIQVAEMRSLLAKYRQLYPDGEKSGRLDRIPTLGTNFAPTTADADQVSPSSVAESRVASSSSTPSPHLPIHRPYISVSPVPTPALTDEDPDCDLSDDEVTVRRALVLPFTRMTLKYDEENFQGKASSMMFVKAALHSKQRSLDASNQDINTPQGVDDVGDAGLNGKSSSGPSLNEKTDAWKGKEVRKGVARTPAEDYGIRFHSEHPQVWSDHEWVLKTTEEPHTPFEFPPKDLMDSLLDIYFSTTNLFSPVFHEPTFMQDYRSGLHLRNSDFGAIVLLMCADAAKRSDDPRVLLDVERLRNEKIGKNATWDATQHSNGATYYSAGWTWFDQVRKTRLAVSFKQPSLYDMQIEYLIVEYSKEASGSMSVRWSSLTSGLRYAQLLGAHRRKAIGTRPTVEGELRKRVFWALLLHDRRHAAGFGRPCTLHDEDFDVDLPLACDDEYWINPDPEKAFRQPEDKPSKVVFFNCMLTLFQIKAYVLRTIYSLNKSKPLLGLAGRDRQQGIITEVDSALNKWLDHLPPHLQWNPKMENDLFFMQSANLHAQYYSVRILVHRPFISTSRDTTESFNPSLTICANAARTCINILDEQFKRLHVIHERHPLLMSSLVLLIDVWAGKKAKKTAEEAKKMMLVYRAMHMMKSMERWSPGAARIWDALNNMITVGDWEALQRQGRTDMAPSPSRQPQQHWEQGAQAATDDTEHSQGFLQHQPHHTPDFLPATNPNLASQSHMDRSSHLSHRAPPMQNHWQDLNAGYQPVPPSQAPSSSTFASTSGTPMSVDDVMMHPSIDPMIDVLLNMLDPGPYQPSQMFSSNIPAGMGTSSHPSHQANEFVAGAPLWDSGMLGSSLSRGGFPDAPTTASGLAGFMHTGMTSTSGATQFDASTTWPQGQNGYPRWEDWAANLADFRTYGEDPYGASQGGQS